MTLSSSDQFSLISLFHLELLTQDTTVTCSGIATDPNDGIITSSIQYEWLVGASVVGTGSHVRHR